VAIDDNIVFHVVKPGAEQTGHVCVQDISFPNGRA